MKFKAVLLPELHFSVFCCFSKEEKIEAANSSSTFNNDSSWKVPNGSNILMRTSQVSSEFEDGHHSYLRLSLGQFFEQRSEALGCLGSNDDVVKRVRTFFFLLHSKLTPVLIPFNSCLGMYYIKCYCFVFFFCFFSSLHLATSSHLLRRGNPLH